MPPERSAAAFAPGRVNLIGEHTDYNDGFALPFAIAQGVTVRAFASAPARDAGIFARAEDIGETDEFPLSDPPCASGWRAYVRGVVSELSRAGYELGSARLEISGDVPQGGGLSSSAALEVALALALEKLCADGASGEPRLERIEMARLCARVENEWVGAHTGLLDQLASLFGVEGSALRIDFRSLAIEEVPLALGAWRMAVADSGERHAHADSGYNERRAECRRACELLGVSSLREAGVDDVERLPEPLRSRARHVLGENERVLAAVAALRAGDVPTLAELMNASHASLRDLYEVSTPRVEETVSGLRDSGAAGARMIGGGFGGAVLGLFPSHVALPDRAREVRAGAGAHVL